MRTSPATRRIRRGSIVLLTLALSAVVSASCSSDSSDSTPTTTATSVPVTQFQVDVMEATTSSAP